MEIKDERKELVLAILKQEKMLLRKDLGNFVKNLDRVSEDINNIEDEGKIEHETLVGAVLRTNVKRGNVDDVKTVRGILEDLQESVNEKLDSKLDGVREKE